MSAEKIISSKAPDPVGLYPHARKVGNFLFLSGVGPREKGNSKIPGVELDELTKEQADYIGVAVEGPYKNDEYRY